MTYIYQATQGLSPGVARMNREKYNVMRKKYLEGCVTHQDFYMWLAAEIGATEEIFPEKFKQEIAESADVVFNDIVLGRWDSYDSLVRPLAYKVGLAWSLSDTVCVMKALAEHIRFRERITRRLQGKLKL